MDLFNNFKSLFLSVWERGILGVDIFQILIGIGIVKVIKESFIDKTDKTGRFVAVTVQFKCKLSKPVTLESIKKNKDLSHLALIKQSRLSVMPVDYKSWKIINNMSKI